MVSRAPSSPVTYHHVQITMFPLGYERDVVIGCKNGVISWCVYNVTRLLEKDVTSATYWKRYFQEVRNVALSFNTNLSVAAGLKCAHCGTKKVWYGSHHEHFLSVTRVVQHEARAEMIRPCGKKVWFRSHGVHVTCWLQKQETHLHMTNTLKTWSYTIKTFPWCFRRVQKSLTSGK